MRATSFIATAATAAVLAGSLAAPASAESIGVRDPADVPHGVDLRAVHVNYGEHNLRVTLHHTNLRPDYRSGSGGAVFIDTDSDDKGPELVLVGGYFQGTDYMLLHTEGFGTRTWGEPVEGSYEMRPDYTKEQTRMRISRKALGRPDRVRVAVRVGGQRTDGTQVVDWLRKRFGWTFWVDRG